MKVTININGVAVEIQLTPEQEALAIKQAKPKFEWSYEEDNTFYLTTTHIDTSDGSSSISMAHGRYRKTQQAAEQSLARNKRANRLEALAEQLGGLAEFNVNRTTYYISYDTFWQKGYSTNYFYPEVVYMTEACATKICRMLNAGEFSLDNEL